MRLSDNHQRRRHGSYRRAAADHGLARPARRGRTVKAAAEFGGRRLTSTEALREPVRDTDFSSRTGYESGFPQCAGPGCVLVACDACRCRRRRSRRSRQGAQWRHDPPVSKFLDRHACQAPAGSVHRRRTSPRNRSCVEPDPSEDYTRRALDRARAERPGTLVSRPAAGGHIPDSRRVLHQGPQGFRQGSYRAARRRRMGPHL